MYESVSTQSFHYKPIRCMFHGDDNSIWRATLLRKPSRSLRNLGMLPADKRTVQTYFPKSFNIFPLAFFLWNNLRITENGKILLRIIRRYRLVKMATKKTDVEIYGNQENGNLFRQSCARSSALTHVKWLQLKREIERG